MPRNMLVDFNKGQLVAGLHGENLRHRFVWLKFTLVIRKLEIVRFNIFRDRFHNFSFGQFSSMLDAKEILQVYT